MAQDVPKINAKITRYQAIYDEMAKQENIIGSRKGWVKFCDNQKQVIKVWAETAEEQKARMMKHGDIIQKIEELMHQMTKKQMVHIIAEKHGNFYRCIVDMTVIENMDKDDVIYWCIAWGQLYYPIRYGNGDTPDIMTMLQRWLAEFLILEKHAKKAENKIDYDDDDGDDYEDERGYNFDCADPANYGDDNWDIWAGCSSI
eukprot:543304_1